MNHDIEPTEIILTPGVETHIREFVPERGECLHVYVLDEEDKILRSLHANGSERIVVRSAGLGSLAS